MLHIGLAVVTVLISEFCSEIGAVMTKVPAPTNSSKVLFTSPSFPPPKINKNTRVSPPTCLLESCNTEQDPVQTDADNFFGNDLSEYDNEVVDDSEIVYDDDIVPETTLSSVQNKSSKEEKEALEPKVLPRLIAVKVPAVPPQTELKNDSRPLHTIYSKYPTVRLADFARKIIFPEWIWTKFTPPPIVKKSETVESAGPDSPSARPADLSYNETFVPSTTTRRPKGMLERPTITFDNNMSRCTVLAMALTHIY